jgi:hypothetical protein
MIETSPKPRDTGMKVTAPCGWDQREAMKRIRECRASIRLDLDTLIWTRCAAFPVSMLEGQLKMPAVRLAARRFAVDLPANPVAKRA